MKLIKNYKKILLLAFISSSIFLFSGCTSLKTIINTVISPFESHTTLPKEIIVTLPGTIIKEDTFFTSYSFLSEKSELFTLNTSKKFSKDLQYYENKNVVITGIISNFVQNEKTNIVTFEKNITIIDITYFTEDENTQTTWDIFTPQYFTISFSHPVINFDIEEKIVTTDNTMETLSTIITNNNDTIFFTITKNINIGWKQRFKTEGTEIQFGKWQAYRLFSGKQILFYIPDADIQIDYWGERKDIPLFYTIIKTLKNTTQKIDTNTENQTKKSTKKKTINKNINANIEQPTIAVIIEKILENPSQHLEQSNEYHNRILVDKIEYFGNFLSVEYKILGSDPYESILKAERKKKVFSIEWKSIFYEEFYLQKIVEWKKGREYLWELIDGNIPDIGIYKKYFLRNVRTKYISKIPDNFLILLSPSYKYSITYPKKMYYEIFTDNDIIEGVKWSNAPFNSDEKDNMVFDITLTVKHGNIDTYTEFFSKNSINIPKSESAHFVLTGNKNITFSVLQKMAKSIIVY